MKAVKYLFLILLFTSCKSTKNTIATDEFKNLNPKQLVRKISNSNSKFKTYQSKAKLRLNNLGKKKSYGVNIRIIKNEAIWLSSAAGIVRALLTKDSIYYYNKLEKKYLISDYKNVENIVGLNLTYKMIENLLLSEPITKIKRSDYNNEMSNSKGTYVFNWQLTNIDYKNKELFTKVNNQIANSFEFEGHYKINPYNYKLDICSFKVIDLNDSFLIYEIIYQDFIKVENQYFSSKIRIDESKFSQSLDNSNIKEGTLMNQINIELKSINLNKNFKLPFKIPENYKKIIIDVK
ncbi:DUF4292 domain-containing protein [Flavobacteriaceae bacterium]|nr:DUF4292 domain-containing protein [Flavobacteriaceae bacterium]